MSLRITQGSKWFWLDTDTQVAYPTGDISTRALSKTATAGSSDLVNAAATVIDRIQQGPLATGGILNIYRADDLVTPLHEIPLAPASATNMGTGVMVDMDILLEGPLAFMANTTGACDLYVYYRTENNRV